MEGRSMDARSNPDDARPRRGFRPRLWWLMAIILGCALIFGGWSQLERQRRAMEMDRLQALRADELAIAQRAVAQQQATQQSQQPAIHADKAQQIQALKDQIAELEAKLKALESRAKP
jgi:uncharacterized protein HemX